MLLLQKTKTVIRILNSTKTIKNRNLKKLLISAKIVTNNDIIFI